MDCFVSNVQFTAFYPQGIHLRVILQVSMLPEWAFSATQSLEPLLLSSSICTCVVSGINL